MYRRSQLLYTVFAGSNDLDAPGVPHVVLRKMVHEKYHNSAEGEPVNDIAVFRVRICAASIIITTIIILSDKCWLSLPVVSLYRTNADMSTALPEER